MHCRTQSVCAIGRGKGLELNPCNEKLVGMIGELFLSGLVMEVGGGTQLRKTH